MNNLIHIEGKDLYLSKKYLKQFVSLKTIEYWNEDRGFFKMELNNEAYFLYSSIPFRTRKKLLSPERIIAQDRAENTKGSLKDQLQNAYYSEFAKYKSIYEKDQFLTPAQISKFAKLHAVFNFMIDYKIKQGNRSLNPLLEALNNVMPGKYKSTNALSNAIRKAAADGIESLSIDKRVYGNNNRQNRESAPHVDYVVALLTASPAKFTNPVLLEKANTYFREMNMKEMKISWMKLQRRKWLANPEVLKSRDGAKASARQLPYASLKNATYSNVQWQIDGATLPFWEQVAKNGANEKFHRSTVVIVMDNCSKKIVGYAVGYTENGETIKVALYEALKDTSILPNEIVMDNHSFTKSNEAFHFEQYLKTHGSQLTKTSNPRQKVIVERSFQYLTMQYKKYHGCLGESVRSKSPDSRPSDEMMTLFSANQKTHEEVVAIVTASIYAYNNTAQNGITPNEKYEANPHPHPNVLSQFNKAELMPVRVNKLIRQSQINISSGAVKFEYQLPAHLHQQWNNKEVIVTYENLNEGIYLFDKTNGKEIIFLHQKQKINNAKYLQTDEDLQGLYMNKGKLKGIETKSKNQLTNLKEVALNRDPEAYERIDRISAPKSVIKELQQNAELKLYIEDKGINTDYLPDMVHTYDVPASLKPKDTTVKNPFKVSNNEMKLIDPMDYKDED